MEYRIVGQAYNFEALSLTKNAKHFFTQMKRDAHSNQAGQNHISAGESVSLKFLIID